MNWFCVSLRCPIKMMFDKLRYIKHIIAIGCESRICDACSVILVRKSQTVEPLCSCESAETVQVMWMSWKQDQLSILPSICSCFIFFLSVAE